MRRQKINWFCVRVVFRGFPSLSGGEAQNPRPVFGALVALPPKVPPGLRVQRCRWVGT